MPNGTYGGVRGRRNSALLDSGRNFDLWWWLNQIGFQGERRLWKMSELKKVSVRRFQTSKNSLSEPNENLLVFWWCSEIFCRFWALFCINHFSDLQKSKHEKRLETDVSSLRNSVIMRRIKSRFTFGDRCSTNWAIPLNIWLLRSKTRSLAVNIIA